MVYLAQYFWTVAAIPLIYLLTYTPLHVYVKEDHRGGSLIAQEFRIAKYGRQDGRDLNQFFSSVQKPSTGVTAAGGLAYTYEGKVIDLMGLNNIEMAHALEIKRAIKITRRLIRKLFIT